MAEPVTSGGLTGYSIHMVVSLTSSISMIIKFGLPLTVPTDMRQINTESNSMFNISLLFRRSLLNVTTHFRSKFNTSDYFRDCLQTQQTRHCVVQKVSTLREGEREYDCFLHFLRLLAVCWPSAQFSFSLVLRRRGCP